MSEIKPFSPADALKARKHIIPPFVIEAVNTLLSSRYREGEEIRILQKELVAEVQKAAVAQTGEMPSSTVLFDNKWLDIEPIYEKQGWEVHYDKPAYCENYEPFFVFKPARTYGGRRA